MYTTIILLYVITVVNNFWA